MEILDKNIKIAEWLGWKYFNKGLLWKGGKEGNSLFSGWITQELNDYNLPIIVVEDNRHKTDYERKLKFHYDSNWQWLCLEKIAKDCGKLLSEVIKYLEDNHFKELYPILDKQDLFEAIYNYTTNGNKNI